MHCRKTEYESADLGSEFREFSTCYEILALKYALCNRNSSTNVPVLSAVGRDSDFLCA